jgi:hypothetical protein
MDRWRQTVALGHGVAEHEPQPMGAGVLPRDQKAPDIAIVDEVEIAQIDQQPAPDKRDPEPKFRQLASH